MSRKKFLKVIHVHCAWATPRLIKTRAPKQRRRARARNRTSYQKKHSKKTLLRPVMPETRALERDTRAMIKETFNLPLVA